MAKDFLPSLEKLKSATESIQKQGIDLSKEIDRDKLIYDFKAKQSVYYLDSFHTALKKVKESSMKLNDLIAANPQNENLVTDIMQLMPELDIKNAENLLKTVTKMETLASQLDIPRLYKFDTPTNIPSDIYNDVQADLEELNKCFKHKCNRSAVILCGRLIETALHWKYFDVTAFDLLEKNPNMGLGILIAKLREKNIELDPALQQQIHLINQVRIFSVHKKQEAFLPSDDQTHAIILYTLDTLNKLFKKQ